jgi:hypothetical protein
MVPAIAQFGSGQPPAFGWPLRCLGNYISLIWSPIEHGLPRLARPKSVKRRPGAGRDSALRPKCPLRSKEQTSPDSGRRQLQRQARQSAAPAVSLPVRGGSPLPRRSACRSGAGVRCPGGQPAGQARRPAAPAVSLPFRPRVRHGSRLPGGQPAVQASRSGYAVSSPGVAAAAQSWHRRPEPRWLGSIPPWP